MLRSRFTEMFGVIVATSELDTTLVLWTLANTAAANAVSRKVVEPASMRSSR